MRLPRSKRTPRSKSPSHKITGQLGLVKYLMRLVFCCVTTGFAKPYSKFGVPLNRVRAPALRSKHVRFSWPAAFFLQPCMYLSTPWLSCLFLARAQGVLRCAGGAVPAGGLPGGISGDA